MAPFSARLSSDGGRQRTACADLCHTRGYAQRLEFEHPRGRNRPSPVGRCTSGTGPISKIGGGRAVHRTYRGAAGGRSRSSDKAIGSRITALTTGRFPTRGYVAALPYGGA